jgi:glycosyltransferase involved in cell wall biosynthesis
METGDWRSGTGDRRLETKGRAVAVAVDGRKDQVEETVMAKKTRRKLSSSSEPEAQADASSVAEVPAASVAVQPVAGQAPARENQQSAVPLTINWLVTEPFPGSGGHTGIFRMIRHLVDFGHTCHVYAIPVNFMQKYTPAQIEQYVDTHFMRTGAIFHQWNGQTGAADATVATYWKTVSLLQQLPAPGRHYYLVQDFEPYFYPVGAEYIQAENSYRQGLHCITLGPWLARLMAEKYGAEADHFDFAVDTEVYSPIPAPRPAHPRIAFYARPSTPRRAYELGLEALKLLKERQPGVEVIFYGADKLAPPPPFSYSNMGILNPWELARLFSTCDVGLVFSTTNPSFVPFEMMACRCAVVDIRSERVEGLLEDGVNCRLADPTPASIAETLLDLLWNKQQREAIVEAAFQQVKARAWRNSARQIEEVLLRHAPPPAQRVAWQAGKGDDADMLVWQIHQLLDAGAGKAELVDDLRAALYRALAEKAALLAHMRQLEQGYNQQPPAAAGPRMRAAVQPVTDKLLVNTPAWLQGNAPLSKLALPPTGFRQQFQADRSHLCRIELYFAPRQPVHTGTIRFALYADDASNRADAAAAPRLVTAQTFFVVDLPLDRALAIDFPVESDAFGKTYTFTVAPGEVDQHSPGLWHFWQGQHKEARLVEGDHVLGGQLAFQPFFQEQGQLIGPRQGPPAWGEPVRLAPDVAREVVNRGIREASRLTTRAREAVKGQGMAGLARELMNYVQWQLTKGSQG